MWILIVVYSIGGPGSLAQAVQMQEFTSEANCLDARAWLTQSGQPRITIGGSPSDYGGGLQARSTCNAK